MDDREIYAKFERNAASLLSKQDIEQALKTMLSLEELENVSHLMGYLRQLP